METSTDTVAATGEGESARARLRRGDVVGRYVVLNVVGAGGMGVVHAAYDPDLDRKVAIKLLHTDEHRDLRGEARAMARLSHPNVVAVHDVGERDGRVFVAMDFVEGTTLRQWLREQRSPAEILEVFVDAGRGLEAAHIEGIVHRDFKPENVMLDAKARVRVTDFGLARPSAAEPTDSDANLDVTQSRLAGTPAYMAPEQHRGEKAGPSADQFAFCVALWEALYGARPFAGATAGEVAASVVRGAIEPVHPASAVPRRIRDVLLRGLATDPEQRWPTMRALLAELHAPRRVRWWWLALGGAAAIAIAAVGGQSVAASRDRTRCDRQSAAIDGVWNARRGAEASAAVSDQGLSFGDDVMERVRPRLDAYAVNWAQARNAACVETRVHGTVTAERWDRIRDCFDARLAAFGAVVGGLLQPDRRSVINAQLSVATLGAVEDCVDDRRRPLATLPSDPAAAEAVRSVRLRLVEVEATTRLGRYAESLEIVEELRPLADRHPWEPLNAELLLREGIAQSYLGRTDEAVPNYEAAFSLATRSAADDVALEAATQLVWEEAHRERLDSARHWRRMAEMLVTRLGLTDAVQGGKVLRSVGMIHYHAGDFAPALAAFKDAVAVYEALAGPSAFSVAEMVHNVGLSASELGQHDEALAAFERELKIKTETLGPRHPLTAMALNGIGIVQRRTDNLPEALQSYEAALEIRRGAFGDDHIDVARSFNNLAGVHAALKDLEAAERALEQSMSTYRRLYGEDHPEVANGLSNLASLQLARGAPDVAIATLGRAIAVQRRVFNPGHPYVASSLNLLGRAQRDSGDPKLALVAHEEAHAIRGRKLGKENPATAQSELELALDLLALDRKEDARPHLMHAFPILDPILPEGDDVRVQLLDALVGLGIEEVDLRNLQRDP